MTNVLSLSLSNLSKNDVYLSLSLCLCPRQPTRRSFSLFPRQSLCLCILSFSVLQSCLIICCLTFVHLQSAHYLIQWCNNKIWTPPEWVMQTSQMMALPEKSCVIVFATPACFVVYVWSFSYQVILRGSAVNFSVRPVCRTAIV